MVDDLLGTLVAFDTTSHKPVTPMVAWLAEHLEQLGLKVRLVDDPCQPGKCNVFATVGPQGTDGLLLTGHMDVVPTAGQPWTSNPYHLTRRGVSAPWSWYRRYERVYRGDTVRPGPPAPPETGP